MALRRFPLQPLSAGDILDQAVRLYRRHFASILRLVLIPFAVTVPLSIWADSIADGGEGLSDLLRTLPVWSSLLIANQWLGSLGGAALARWVAYPDFSPTTPLWKFYGPVLRRSTSLACIAVLDFTLWIGFVLLPIGGVVGTIAVAMDSWSTRTAGLTAVAVAVSGAIALGGMVMVTRLSLTVVVIALEGVSWPAALRRSWRLVRGHFWRATAIVLFALALELGPLLLFRVTGSLMYEVIPPPAEQFLIQVVSVVISPIALIALALLYYDCRIRGEAFDLEVLARNIGPPQKPQAGGSP